MVEAAPQGNLFCCQSSDGRFYIKLCHFSRPEAVTAAAASTALGRIAVKMADLLMNSAIPSEGSMRTSWPALRKPCCANLRVVVSDSSKAVQVRVQGRSLRTS